MNQKENEYDICIDADIDEQNDHDNGRVNGNDNGKRQMIDDKSAMTNDR